MKTRTIDRGAAMLPIALTVAVTACAMTEPRREGS